MASRRKTALVVLIVLAVALIVLMVVVPRLANLDRYRPQVVARLEQSTGRSASIGRLSLSVLPVLAVRADDIAIGNPPGFPGTPFLEIHRAYAELDPLALLQRRVVIRSLKLEAPSVNLVSNSGGRWNTESAAPARIQLAAYQTPPAPTISISKVRVEDGRVTSTDLASGGTEPPSFEADGVAAELDDVNADALGVHLAALNEPGIEGSKFEAPWRRRVRPAVLREPGPGAEGGTAAWPAGLPRLSGPLGAHGAFTAEAVRVNEVRGGRLKSGVEIFGGGVMLNGLVLELCGGRVSGDLVWDSASAPARFATRLAVENVDLSRLLQGIPSARGKITGALEGRLSLSGLNVRSPDPLANKQGTGNMTVRNGTLPTLQLNRNLMLLMKSVINAGQAAGDPSSFKSVSADLEIGGGEIRSRQITIQGNGVDVDAAGSLALAGAGRLDYTGVSKINARTTGFTSLIAGALGSKMSADGKVKLPFTLTGTLDQPHFGLKGSRWFH